MQDLSRRAIEFGYINARLCAASSFFLSRETLEVLCEVKNVDTMIELLQNTAYGPYIEELRTRYHGFELISKVVMRRFSRKIAQIEKMLENTKKVELLYIATGKLEVYNLRLLFAEVLKKRDLYGEYIEVGDVSKRKLELLREIGDVEQVKKIVSDMGYHIKDSSESYAEIIDDIETAYYGRLKELKKKCEDEPELKLYIEKMIDYKNFDLAIRAISGNIKEPKFLSGGFVPISRLQDAVKEGYGEVARVFDISDLYELYNNDLSWLEEMYDRKILKWAISMGASKPFSMIGVVSFIRRLDVERRNIRSIAIAKNLLSPEEIKKRIIW